MANEIQLPDKTMDARNARSKASSKAKGKAKARTQKKKSGLFGMFKRS
jgi:hypothetical protein